MILSPREHAVLYCAPGGLRPLEHIMRNRIVSLLRSLMNWLQPTPPPNSPVRSSFVSRAELRAALAEMLADPNRRRIALRGLIGTAFPIQGGQSTPVVYITRSEGSQ